MTENEIITNLVNAFYENFNDDNEILDILNKAGLKTKRDYKKYNVQHVYDRCNDKDYDLNEAYKYVY